MILVALALGCAGPTVRDAMPRGTEVRVTMPERLPRTTLLAADVVELGALLRAEVEAGLMARGCVKEGGAPGAPRLEVEVQAADASDLAPSRRMRFRVRVALVQGGAPRWADELEGTTHVPGPAGLALRGHVVVLAQQVLARLPGCAP